MEYMKKIMIRYFLFFLYLFFYSNISFYQDVSRSNFSLEKRFDSWIYWILSKILDLKVFDTTEIMWTVQNVYSSLERRILQVL